MSKARLEILRVLAKESPLTPMGIASRTDINLNSVRPYLTILRRRGFIKYFKDIIGMAEITEEGRKHIEENPDG